MEIDDIRAFVAVADAGSVSAAARELFLTQPAVTRRLQRLESAMGAPLLDRRRRPFALTRAGAAAIERCRGVLASMSELRSAASVAQGPAGELRVAVAHALTELTMVGPLGRVQRQFPQVQFRLGTGWSRDLLDRVKSGAMDAAFVLLPHAETPPFGLTAASLASEELIVVAQRRSGRRDSARLRVADLSAKQWILNPEGCAARSILRRAVERSGTMRVAVETYNYELQLSLVASGRGLGLVPSRLLARSQYRARVQPVEVKGVDLTMTIWSVRGRPPVPLASVLDEIDQVIGRTLQPRKHR